MKTPQGRKIMQGKYITTIFSPIIHQVLRGATLCAIGSVLLSGAFVVLAADAQAVNYQYGGVGGMTQLQRCPFTL